MKSNNYLSVIDFGSNTLRLGVFDEKLNNLYLNSKEIIQKNNNDEYIESINFLIRDSEKKISNHIENINVLYVTSEIHSIDISMKRDFDQKILIENVYISIITEVVFCCIFYIT